MIEQTPETVAANIRPEEAEAIRILWRKGGAEDETVPATTALQYLAEIRRRQAEIEHQIVSRVIRHKFSEGRKTPRRHQLVALAVLALTFVLVMVILALFR